MRELKKSDFDLGFLKSLNSLRQATGISSEKAEEIFRYVQSSENHLILVAVKDETVVGTITLIIEPKFIHKGSLVGHIEDVSVDEVFQGTGAGDMLVKAALKKAKDCGCYKTILDCQEDVVGFYEKIGFKKSGHAMRFEH